MEFYTLAKMKKLYPTEPATKYNRAAVYNIAMLDDIPEYKQLDDYAKNNILNDIKRNICGVNDFTMICFETGFYRVYVDLDFTITRIDNDIKSLYFYYNLTGCRVAVYDIRDGLHALPTQYYTIGKFSMFICKGINNYTITA